MTKPSKINQDLKKLRKNKQFLAILILLFVALLFWMTISLITSQTTQKISTELIQLAKPLTPVIDGDTIDQIEAKKSYSQEELSGFTIFKVLISRDGKTERIVPIEVTIDDLEPKETPRTEPLKSLLNNEVNNESEQSPLATESATTPDSDLGSQL